MRRRRVIDGKLVNIPVLFANAKGGRKRLGMPGDGLSRYKRVGGRLRKIRVAFITLRRDVGLALRCTEKVLMLNFQEKPLSYSLRGTVPQTDTGRRVENTKAHEGTRVKELGKMVP